MWSFWSASWWLKCSVYSVYLRYILLNIHCQNLYKFIICFWHLSLFTSSSKRKGKVKQDILWPAIKREKLKVKLKRLVKWDPKGNQYMAANWVLASSLCIYVVAVLIRGDDSQAGTSALLCDAENHIFIIKRNPDPVKCLPQTKGQLPGVQTIKYPPF